ncbi:hypothetical protein A3L09_08035 [Thermococcus profundus]|uniref:Uncharacterized protein n=1 Tax=Thermococcus profundus TaxID=49899 RepID=A0A2Z2MEV7_THEPR|nr:hypothetical protein [Thermococcus profundus]ASJ03205.1 hypothetical protein A3L09_08035 [Thermococcus profundus]
MDLHSIFRMALNLQRIICCGSVTVSMGGDSITITRDEIILDINNPKKIKKLMDAFSTILGKDKGGIGEKKEMMNEMKLYAEDLASQGKTVVIKYQGNEVVKMGAEASSLLMNAFGMKHIEIKYKLDTLRMMKDFM